MSITTIGPLEVDEVKIVRFDFSTEAEEAAGITTPVVTCVLLDGTDASPSAVMFGAPSVNGKFVIQIVKPGVVGCFYKLRATCLDSDGAKHGMTAHLRVVPG
jgi:hypothetical protein